MSNSNDVDDNDSDIYKCDWLIVLIRHKRPKIAGICLILYL